MTITTMTLYRI